MDVKIFKSQISHLLKSKGFIKQGSSYYSFQKGIIIVISLQKSNFSNSYYINIGYVICELNPSIINPKETDGDIRARFSFEENGKLIDVFDLEKIEENGIDSLSSIIEKNIHKYVDNITSLEDIIKLLEKNKIMLFQTKLVAKKLMGFEDNN